MVPVRIVAVIDTARMMMVLRKPVAIRPLVQAILKFSKFSQFSGRDRGLVVRSSLWPLNAPKITVTRGAMTIRLVSTRIR